MEGNSNPESVESENLDLSLPLYNELPPNTDPKIYLSINELVAQTHQFMEQFRSMAKSNQLPGTIFFLDKSARPLAYMFRKLFSKYCPDSVMPNIRFVNIGGGALGPDSGFDVERPFKGDPQIIRQNYKAFIDSSEPILVVDEFSSTGDTLDSAEDVIGRAFPETRVKGMSVYDKMPKWMTSKAYLGVRELTWVDYQRLALAQLNQEAHTKYKTADQLYHQRGSKGESMKTKFEDIYQQIEGTIPTTSRSPRMLREYRTEPLSLVDKILKRTPKKTVISEQNLFIKARSELDQICKRVAELSDKEYD